MSNDLLITPGSRKQEFKDSSGNVDAKIETDANGNLLITNPGGDISIGDTTADIFVGDGANNVDIVFEQDGEIRGTSGVTITLGASGSNVRMATDLNLNSNDLTNVGTLTVNNLTVNGTTTTVSSTNTTITDNIIELNSGLTGANSKDIGFIFERGSTGNNAGFVWDESADRFTVFTTTDTASSSTVNTGTVANFQAGSFFGNGANLSSLNASNISSGTIADARIPSLAASKITSGTFADGRIPSLAASKITSGTFADGRIPSLAASKITSGTFADARIPSLAASKITSGTFATARIPTLNQNTTGTAGGLSGTPTISVANITQSNSVTLTHGELVSADTGRRYFRAPNSNTVRGAYVPFVENVRQSGVPLFFDEDFNDGFNSVGVYNNAGGGTVTHTRVTATDEGFTAPNSSGKVIKIVHNGGTSSPGFGGFVQAYGSAANRIIVQIFVAKLPVGRSLVTAQNAQGTNAQNYFLTSTAGTGKFETYVRVANNGDSGSFSSGGHVYVSGGSGGFTWYLASCNAYVVTSRHAIGARQVIAGLQSNSPAFIKGGDTDTGVCFPGSNQVGLTVGNSRKLHVDSNTVNIDNCSTGLRLSSGNYGGDGSGLTNLNASSLASGTVADARIPNLAASKITSGTFADGRIPNLAASKITSGTFADARIPSLAASKITSGTFATARIPTLNQNTSGTAANLSGTPNISVGTISSGDITISDGTPQLKLSDSNNGGGGAAQGIIKFSNTGGDALGIGYTSNIQTNSDFLISSDAGGTFGGHLGLDSGGIADARSHIILEPKTNLMLANGGTNGGAVFQIGLPGNGTNTNGCFFSIEGNTHTDGEGTGRIFFREHNSSTAAMDNFGMSLGYRGGNTTITTAGGNSNTSANLVGNGQWFMVGHDSSNQGALIMYGDRQATFVNFAGNTIQNASIAASLVNSGTFADARIPSLAASKITSGTFADARIPSLAASKITSGTFADGRIPSLAASKITSGTFANARISSSSISQHGFITGLSFNNLSSKTSGTGQYSTDSHLQSGRGSGGVAMTINDGYGNANLTFNHLSGVPEQNGQAARIEVNTDGTSTEGLMSFEVSSADVTSGSAVNLVEAMNLAHDYMEIPYRLRHKGDTNTYMQFDSDRIQFVAGGVTKLDTNQTYLTGITSSQVTTALGFTPAAQAVNVSTNSDLRLVFSNAGALNVDAHGDLSYNPSTNLLNINGAFIQGPATSQVYSYAPHLSAASASIQLTFGRTTDSTGTGAIGADSTNCFAVWNTASTARRFRVTHGGDAYFVGDLYVPDQIFHDGDTNTYLQFHAADQFRVVTGGSERLEVNNTRTTVNNGYLQITGSTSHQVPTTSATAHTIRLGNIDTHKSGIVIDTTSTAIQASKRCYTIKNDAGDKLVIGNQDSPNTLQVHNEGHIETGGDVFIGSTLRVPEYIRHNGDDNTHIRFTADRIRLVSGNVEMLDLQENGAGTATFIDIVDRVRIQRDGDLLAEGDVVAFTTQAVSDINQKENIKPIKNAVSKVKRLAGVTFDWKKDKKKSAGIIAQDVEKVLPEIVKEKEGRDGKEFKTVDYNGIIGLLVEGMKEQQEEIEKLKKLLEDK